MSIKQKLKSVFFRFEIATGLDTLFAGLSSNAFFRKFIPPPRYYGQHIVRNISDEGARFSIHPADYMQWTLLAKESDHALEAALLAIQPFNEQLCVLDIGANCGQFSIRLASRLKAGNTIANIHAFEPNPKVVESFQKNLSLNPALSSSISLHQKGVGDKPGMLEISVPVRNSGAGSLAYNFNNEPHENFQVDIVTVDEFIKSKQIDKVHFMKIDVETFEPLVLQGAAETIARFRPAIYLEFINDPIPAFGLPQDFIYKFLTERQYAIHLETGNGFKQIGSFNDIADLKYCNLLALQPDQRA
ncbi:MAG: FkbM family methyltransferase [Chitinophagaceae bacterium]|nr:FkbM family methyltransferase [Chitinophagaceae bacterium]